MPQRNLPALMVEWARAITVSFASNVNAWDSIDIRMCQINLWPVHLTTSSTTAAADVDDIEDAIFE
jgi:hypothetical protein